MRIVILDGRTLDQGEASWQGLAELGELVVHERTDPGDVVSRSFEADLLLTNKTPVTARDIERLPKLRYIGVLATGFDVVDVEAARRRGIPVTNVPVYGTDSVAQLTFALLLELCHGAGLHAEAVRAGDWSRSPDWCFWKTPLVELAGKTMGVVGFGRIGRRVARIAQAFGMRSVAHHPGRTGRPDEGIPWIGLDDLLAVADVVSLHCPLTLDTSGMINAERLRRMKPTAFLLNTSRGKLIVERDLADALAAGRLAGAAVDVLSTEPPAPDNPLLAAPNCLVTPHLAWATREARARLLAVAVENAKAFLADAPRNVVNLPPALPPAKTQEFAS